MDSGNPGSCADITWLKRCILWDKLHGNSAFDEGQYIIGDSGYVNAPHMVALYKNTYGQEDKEEWNHIIAKTRYVNEHCIGVLKSCWFSLKEIRIHPMQKRIMSGCADVLELVVCCTIMCSVKRMSGLTKTCRMTLSRTQQKK